jgi:hypothetical protein
MSTARISSLSAQPIYIPVRVSNPITGDVDLSGATVRVAVVSNEPVATDWSAADSISAGTWVAPDGDAYYIITETIAANTLSKGTKQVWAEVLISGNTFVVRSGPLSVY